MNEAVWIALITAISTTIISTITQIVSGITTYYKNKEISENMKIEAMNSELNSKAIGRIHNKAVDIHTQLDNIRKESVQQNAALLQEAVKLAKSGNEGEFETMKEKLNSRVQELEKQISDLSLGKLSGEYPSVKKND